MKLALRIFGFGFPISICLVAGIILGWVGVGVFLAGISVTLFSLLALVVADGLGNDDSPFKGEFCNCADCQEDPDGE